MVDIERIRWAVRYAAEMMGGYHELAKRLHVTKTEMKEWVDGARAPDPMALLGVLDVVMQEARKLSEEAMAMGIAEAVISRAQHRSRA